VKIPFDRLGIPVEHRDKLLPEAPVRARLAIAKGMLPLPPDVQVSAVYVLLGHKERAVRKAAAQTLQEMDSEVTLRAISQRTHPKVLEYLTEYRTGDQDFMERVFALPNANDRTACMIAGAARGDLVNVICRNQSRLLMTPKVYLSLKANPETTQAQLERVYSFLRMQSSLPDETAPVPALAPATQVEEGTPTSARTAPKLKKVKVSELTEMSIEAEVMAALLNLPSPFTNPHIASRLEILVAEQPDGSTIDGDQIFSFSFQDDAEQFSRSMVTEDDLAPEEKLSVAQQISAMTTGSKIKLAFLGNAEARKLLLRDKNKQVAVAVVKSGRLSDSEAASIAANKNLHGDVLREVAMNKEFLRSYKVKIGLVNNPKCPVSVAVGLVPLLQRSDLASLARNKNVPSVVRRTAKRTVQQRLDNK
jgi:hypothetical protein